jgi:threonyl-tRNA synthetase
LVDNKHGDIKVTIKNGDTLTVPKGTSIEEIVCRIGGRIVKEALAAKVDGQVQGLATPLLVDCQLEILKFSDPEGAAVLWHSTSHVLAQAVKRLYSNVKLGIGPAIAEGFYYDFDFPISFSVDDFDKIEAEMQRIIKEDLPIERLEMSRQEAERFFEQLNEVYKVELIRQLPDNETISCYRQGEFVDLCAGPHLPSTGRIKAFKLLNLAGAYWRGDENRPMLQRIYGTAFPKQKLLTEYLERLEEAKKRDHRRLGRELDLFSFHEEGPGFPFYHPKGMIIRQELENFWHEEHRRAGYQQIQTPIILNRSLWEQSGHWDHYKENMYFTHIDEESYAVKPMNCPGAMLIYRTKLHSYRDLPLRLAELGLVHRHERSGTLHGLLRVRSFTQDDAHIFMLPEQIEDEISGVINLVDRFYSVFGFSYHVELSTRPEKAMGSEEMWEKATTTLREVLDNKELDYRINEGDGAFYGPKIDFHLQDSLGRTWQCGTIQLDFQMPEKFDLTYIGEDGQKHRPVMIHRVIYGAMERFIALLIEHYGGAFPAWLAPVQAVVMPISEKQHEYAASVYQKLVTRGVRAELDDRNEKIGFKIREAQLQKILYMLVIGEKEKTEGNIALRHRSEGDLGAISLESFLEKISEEIYLKK